MKLKRKVLKGFWKSRFKKKGGDQIEDKRHSSFGCVLKGDIKHLKKIRERIVQEYVKLGLVELINPTYDKNEIYILTTKEWKEYQKLKKYREEGLIGG
jgi:hypothetical protein